MSKFGALLYELRKQKGYTQTELADKLNVSNQAVSKWETGECYPETAILLPLAELFDITVDEFLKGELKPKIEIEQVQTEPNDKRVEWFSGITSLLAVVIYLLCGFIWDLWHPTWIIFIVAIFADVFYDIAFGELKKKIQKKKEKNNKQ